MKVSAKRYCAYYRTSETESRESLCWSCLKEIECDQDKYWIGHRSKDNDKHLNTYLHFCEPCFEYIAGREYMVEDVKR